MVTNKEEEIAYLVNKDGFKYESTEDKFYKPQDIPACNPENNCEVIQDFLEEGTSNAFSTFRTIQQECYGEMYQCQNRIEEYKKKIRAEIQDIIVYKQKLDNAFNEYIK